MDKKNIAAVVIVAVIIVLLLAWLFVGDIVSDTAVTVGKTDYSLDDFISYLRAWQKDGTYQDYDTYVESNSDTLEEGYSESDYINEMYSSYQIYKMYAQEANSLGVVLEESEKPTIESGDEVSLLEDYGITSGEYLRVQSEVALANKLFASPAEYISGDSNITRSYIERNNFDPNKIYNTFKYRVVQIPIEQVEEPVDELDISGDVSGDESGEQAVKVQEAKDKAEALLTLVKDASENASGEMSFEDFHNYIVAKNDVVLNNIFAGVFESGDDEISYDVYGYISKAIPNPRYTANLRSVENGELDSISALFMNEDLTGQNSYVSLFAGTLYSSNVVPFLSEAEVGEYSEVFTSDDSTYVGFMVLEDIEKKLSEEDQKRFDNNVMNYYIQSMVEIIPRNKAKVLSIKLEDIVPTIARAAEAKKQAELASGDDASLVEDSGEALVPEVSLEKVSEEAPEELPENE